MGEEFEKKLIQIREKSIDKKEFSMTVNVNFAIELRYQI